MAIRIITEGISDQQKATAEFQFTYRGMVAQLSSPGFIPVLCAREAAHLVYFGFAGVTNYKAFPARITYDPKADDFVGSLASVQILDIPKIKGSKFWDQMLKVAYAYAAGGVIARKLMPSSDGGNEHNEGWFESLCAELKSKNANFSRDVPDSWKNAQDCVAKGLENAEWLSKIQEFAETLQPELGW